MNSIYCRWFTVRHFTLWITTSTFNTAMFCWIFFRYLLLSFPLIVNIIINCLIPQVFPKFTCFTCIRLIILRFFFALVLSYNALLEHSILSEVFDMVLNCLFSVILLYIIDHNLEPFVHNHKFLFQIIFSLFTDIFQFTLKPVINLTQVFSNQNLAISPSVCLFWNSSFPLSF